MTIGNDLVGMDKQESPHLDKKITFSCPFHSQEADGCDYIIIHQRTSVQENDITDYVPFLKAFKNVKFIRTKNECYDLGAIGNVLTSLKSRLHTYQFIIWLNSSVRGPFIPQILRERVHWTEFLTEKINKQVKLVGVTINCEPFNNGPPLPHVQSYCAATDSIGISLLLKQRAFECYRDRIETISKSEIGSSQIVLEAGYNIASLMEKYEVVP